MNKVLFKNFVSNTDKLIVVAMITGSVSIVGVVISSLLKTLRSLIKRGCLRKI